ncbi:ATP-binding protein [Pseudomonadales bacterium]|nr:ATP-binding protein [Pseudomonadales bacterium]
MHLAIMLLAALLYFCNLSFNVKAVFLIGTYNLIATGNLVTFHMWGFGSTGYAIGIFLCWLLYDVRLAILNWATTILIIFFHLGWGTDIAHEFSQTITTLDIIVQILGLVVFLIPIILAMNEGRLQQAEAEAKQQEQYEKMKQAEASKTAFLANMSHEIRTPLNATLGAIQLLERSELNEQQLKYINISKTSSKWLRHVIDDVLDMERITAGALEIEPAWFNSTSLLEEVAIVFEHNAKEAGLHLEVNIGPNVARWLYGDAGKVHQILYNLVGNALKFTEQGKITATLEKLGQGSTYRFTVTDTGIGIPKDRSDDLFEAFTQIDSSLGRKHQGSGLGLAICRHLAQAMGGEIDYQSSQGKGTSFWFDLDFDSEDSVESPIRATYSDTISHYFDSRDRSKAPSGGAAPDATARFNESIPDKAYRVLLAEDSEANSYILQAYLEIAGHTVDSASNGVEALKLAETTPYDAILMDISMPEMDGLEATRRLRSSAGENQNTLVIALTAHVQPEIREQCTEAGMNDFLAKPVSRDQLLEKLDQLIATG